MDKSPEEQAVEKKISQYQNRQKILLNKKRTEEHRARTHRLIGRGTILEAVFPAVVDMEGEEVKAFLIALSRLPGAVALSERDGGCAPKPPHPRQKVTPASRLSLSSGANIQHWKEVRFYGNFSLSHPNHSAEPGQVRRGRCRISERRKTGERVGRPDP